MLKFSTDGASTVDMARDVAFTTTGFTPSGKALLHDGHKLTLLHTLLPLDRHKHLFADVFVDDREYSSQSDPRIPLPGIVDVMKNSILGFVRCLSEYLHNTDLATRVRIRTMSDFFRDNGLETPFMGGDLFKLLLDNRKILRRTFDGLVSHETKSAGVLRPICSECGLGRVSTGGTRSNEFALESSCRTYDCLKQDYTVTPAQGETNWAVHYAVVSMMNLLVMKQHKGSALEVLGGDYGLTWGLRGKPIANRLEATRAAFQNKNDDELRYFIGQLLCRDGRKVSKSHGDGDESDLNTNFDYLMEVMKVRDRFVAQ